MKKSQRKAIEIITGKDADIFHPEAVKAYFAYTDRGVTVDMPEEAKADLFELKTAHKTHSLNVEMWKEDFRKGLLYLTDFIGEGYPQAYVQHAFDIYYSVMGWIPKGTCPAIRMIMEEDQKIDLRKRIEAALAGRRIAVA